MALVQFQHFVAICEIGARAEIRFGDVPQMTSKLVKFVLSSHRQWSCVLMTFPTGKVDDDVDVCSLFGRMLAPVQVFGQAEVARALCDEVKPLFGANEHAGP